MKAVVYKGPGQVSVESVPDPKILHPEDIVVRVTSSAICGSDIPVYEGRTGASPGFIFGHENLGIVDKVGDGVVKLKVGDRVVIPFNVGCGRCKNCEEGFTGFCTTVNPPYAGGGYGYFGPCAGGQADYVRVPYADFNALLLPPGGERESDYVLLADIFPTGWHSVSVSNFKPGENIAIFGGGPVGLMGAYSAELRGASEVFVVDRIEERLQKARSIGAKPINLLDGDPVDQILRATDGEGVDRGIDAVGFRASASGGTKEASNTVVNSLVKIVRPTGGISITGVYVPSVKEGPDLSLTHGTLEFPIAEFFGKGLTIGTGSCNTKKYNRYLLSLIDSGVAKPSFVVSHHHSLEEAPEAYAKFGTRTEGYTKVVLHP